MPTSQQRAEIYHLRKKLLEEGKSTWKHVYKKFPDIPKNHIRKIFTREQRKRGEEREPFQSSNEDSGKDKPPKRTTQQVKFEVKGNSAYALSSSPHIRTLDQLLEACDADLSMWRVTRWLSNVWLSGRKHKVVDLTWNEGVMDGHVQDDGKWNQSQNWQVKAWFSPREEYPYEQALDSLVDDIRRHAPVYNIPLSKIPDGECLMVMNIYDAHIGKRSYDGSYTVDKAAEDFVRAAEGLACQAVSGNRPVSRILFPVGQDILHADTFSGTTTKGTWVEMSADLRDAIDAVCRAVPKAVEIFAAVSPVDIIPVESNHDRIQVHWLAQFLAAYFANHPHVNVRTERAERQYYQWGKVGIGLTHGATKPADLTNVMAVEARKMWGDITWSEWLTGHLHIQRGALYAVESVRGTVVRTIPALCDMDTYHKLHLYVGNHRAAEGLYYHPEHGPAGSFPVFISEL